MADEPADLHDQLIELRAEFDQAATPLQRLVGRVTCHLASPITPILAAMAAAVWVAANIALGRRAPDPPPFAWLETFATLAALVATLLILAGQRREDEAERRRGRLTLHLAAESEQKIAKLIELIEEQRRDSTAMPNRPDPEAERMASPAEPRAVLQRLDSSASG